jgi:hypothetical protein
MHNPALFMSMLARSGTGKRPFRAIMHLVLSDFVSARATHAICK